ncbi:hypothetical protein R1sor_004433 [Riccia sorocarpa]|uniref:Uncharacterized protein n=1 Tax=Riccia sorocarpa TaxID=122646 RepID=A0ABD3HGY0_9MARC
MTLAFRSPLLNRDKEKARDRNPLVCRIKVVIFLSFIVKETSEQFLQQILQELPAADEQPAGRNERGPTLRQLGYAEILGYEPSKWEEETSATMNYWIDDRKSWAQAFKQRNADAPAQGVFKETMYYGGEEVDEDRLTKTIGMRKWLQLTKGIRLNHFRILRIAYGIPVETLSELTEAQGIAMCEKFKSAHQSGQLSDPKFPWEETHNWIISVDDNTFSTTSPAKRKRDNVPEDAA